MMRLLLDVLTFVATAFFLYVGASVLFVGVDCFRHGDVGPYPLSEWADRWLMPCALAGACVVVAAGRVIKRK